LVRFRRKSARSDWLGLGEASRFLGVAPGTLRRWSDAGRINAFTTPGGHRRYRRKTLERLIPQDRTARPSLARSGLTVSRLARAYRTEARSAVGSMPWLNVLTPDQREWFRVHGRQLAEQLVLHLDTADDEERTETLRLASEGAAGYGRLAATLGLSLSQTVEGFLQFRRPFLHQLASLATRRGMDTGSTTELMETAERAMDRLLMSAMAGHGVQRVGESQPRPALEGEARS
jgi:excisionase family DNA binding protein